MDGAADADLIVTDANILGGTPVVRGTRISVYAILGRLVHGDTVADLLADCPELTAEMIEAAAAYARKHPLADTFGGRPWRPST